MADAMDAFLRFGRALKGGKPDFIHGETSDHIEHQQQDGHGKSMAITNYSLAFELNADLTEEHQGKDDENQDHDPKITAIKVNKFVDAATPAILEAVHRGTQYKTAMIVQRKAGGQRDRSGSMFWKIEMDEVTITNLEWSGDPSGQTTEVLTLHVAKGVHVEYYQQKHTGEMGAAIPGAFPILTTSRARNQKDGKNGNGDGTLNASQSRSIVNDVIQQLKRNNPHLNIRG